MHVGNDVRERRPSEEFKPTLGVFDFSSALSGEGADEEMEGPHEGVTEEGALESGSVRGLQARYGESYLHNCFGAHHVCS